MAGNRWVLGFSSSRPAFERAYGRLHGHAGAMLLPRPDLLRIEPPAKNDESLMLAKLAEATGPWEGPTSMELRIYRRSQPDFPYRAIMRHFSSTANMQRRLSDWASGDASFADVAAMLAERVPILKGRASRQLMALCT